MPPKVPIVPFRVQRLLALALLSPKRKHLMSILRSFLSVPSEARLKFLEGCFSEIKKTPNRSSLVGPSRGNSLVLVEGLVHLASCRPCLARGSNTRNLANDGVGGGDWIASLSSQRRVHAERSDAVLPSLCCIYTLALRLVSLGMLPMATKGLKRHLHTSTLAQRPRPKLLQWDATP